MPASSSAEHTFRGATANTEINVPAEPRNGVELEPENATVGSFNGRLRDERLDAHWFLSLGDARNTATAAQCKPCQHTTERWMTRLQFAVGGPKGSRMKSGSSPLGPDRNRGIIIL